MHIENMLHTISTFMKEPVMWALLILLILSAILLGSIAGEAIFRKLKKKCDIPDLIEQINKSDLSVIRKIITRSGLTKIQTDALTGIINHCDLPEEMRTEVAQELISEMETRYEKIIGYTDLIIKIGPVAGLMGTLIPLGPGIMALGQGDTQTLSESILTAFDTTVSGLISAAAATVISSVRKIWYKKDIAEVESVMECLLEKMQTGEN